jgi:hypothetical protein
LYKEGVNKSKSFNPESDSISHEAMNYMIIYEEVGRGLLTLSRVGKATNEVITDPTSVTV